jgi:hypothetical protein
MSNRVVHLGVLYLLAVYCSYSLASYDKGGASESVFRTVRKDKGSGTELQIEQNLLEKINDPNYKIIDDLNGKRLRKNVWI